MSDYRYAEGLKGPLLKTGNLSLTNPALRFFFTLSYWRAVTMRPVLSTKRHRITLKGYQGYELDCHVIEANQLDLDAPTLIYYHGGGFFADLSPLIIQKACFYAHALKCKVFIPRYRTTYRYAYPIPLEDCYESTLDLVEHASQWGINPNKLVLYGDSAGGALAAGVALMARDRKAFKPAFQMLIYPVTDYLQTYPSLRKYENATWSNHANQQMWELYFKGNAPNPIDYASPLHARSLSNLPPAYIEPQEIDTLCDEGIAFANRLQKENGSVILNVIKGSYHAFEKEFKTEFVQSILNHRVNVLKDFFQSFPESKSKSLSHID